MSVIQKEAVRYFISANTGNGFYSLYDSVFENEKFDKIYAIHGGPGTGKSTLMRQICKLGAENGALCEEILCSSDPGSLDGVILTRGERRVGVIDGTAPHPRLITAPGAKEELWNLGAFWNSGQMEDRYPQIRTCNQRKKEAYRHAYARLHAALTVHREVASIYEKELDLSKLSGHIKRIVQRLTRKGVEERCFFRAYSTKGEAKDASLINHARCRTLLCGKKYSAEKYLSVMQGVLQKEGIAHTVFCSPLSPELIDGIHIKETDTVYLWHAFYEGATEEKIINLSRFERKEEREKQKEREARVLGKLEESLICAALSSLADAGKEHFLLEEIYMGSMRFEKMKAQSEIWKDALLKVLLG